MFNVPRNSCHWLKIAPALLLAALSLPGIATAQSRSAASQFNSTTINDQINLQVLNAITKSVYASYTNSCTDPSGTVHSNGTTWSTTCPIPYTPTSGQMSYVCISGYIATQSNTCH